VVLHPRKTDLDLPEEPFEPVDAEPGVKPPLHEKLGSSLGHQFRYLGKDLLLRQQVGVRVVFVAVESAEPALGFAHIGVVDVAVHHEGDQVVRVEPLPDRVRQPAQVQQVGMAQEPQRLVA